MADDSHEISYRIFSKMSSAAVVIGALRVNIFTVMSLKNRYLDVMHVFRKLEMFLVKLICLVSETYINVVGAVWFHDFFNMLEM